MGTDTNQIFRASVVQFEPAPARPDLNLETVRRMAADAVTDGARLVIFPEMCLLGYWHLTKQTAEQLREWARPVAEATASVVELARELDAGIGVGYLEHGDDGRLYNSYSVCLPDGAVHTHRKLHAFEHEAIDSGDRYTVFDTPWNIRMGILICWDNNLIENVRATALLGAAVLIAPHQTGGTNSRSPRGMKPIPVELWENRTADPDAIEEAFRGPSGRDWLMRWLPSRAHDNGLFVLFSNGVGRDDDEIRTGNAMILGPYGDVLAETWAAADAIVTADLDLTELPLSSGRRWMRGRRPELYGILATALGDEQDARTARFSPAPVSLDHDPENTPARKSEDSPRLEAEGDHASSIPPTVPEIWEQQYAEAGQRWSGNPNAALVSTLSGLTPPDGGRALDVGCGEGADTLWLAERGWEATGIDLSATAIRRAQDEAARRSLVSARFAVSDAADWAQRHGGGYDLVTVFFLHTRGGVPREPILRQAASMVAAGGRLLVVSHASMPPWAHHEHEGAGHHPEQASITPDGERRALNLGDDWAVEVAEIRTRDAVGPDGESARLDDSILLVRRLP